jgi:hypothetical protein
MMRHHRGRGIEARIKKDRAQQGLQGIRQESMPGESRRSSTHPAEAQMLAQPEFPGDLRQGLAAHQGRPQPRQGALIRLRMRVVEHARHAQLRIESPRNSSRSLCSRAGAAMRERRAAQGRFTKT